MTKRERLYPEIKRLREDEGLKWREIGERVGLSPKTAFDYYNDPAGVKAAQRKHESDVRTRMTCGRCGGPTGPRRWKAETCATCYVEELKRAKRERMDDIAQLWNEGATIHEIRAYLGYGPNSNPDILSEMMRLGLIEARREGYRRKHAERAA
jgi:hypothetical protein